MANPKKSDDKKKITRKPSALKRYEQSEKRRLANRSYRAMALTTIRSLEEAIAKKADSTSLKSKLDAVYQVMDRAVQKGIYTANKAARTKSRLSARLPS